ncbi:MAG: cytochrome C [Denitrovibrio sp.]|nr:MAG: cytochrome C [Denitrovibrio sp.]
MWQKIKEFSGKDPLLFTIILAIAITAGGFGFVMQMHMTSGAKFCKTCHPKEEIAVRGEYYTWRKGVHSEVDVSCLDCHGAPGIKGYMNAHIVAGMRSMYHELFTPEEEVIKHLTEFGSTVEGAQHAASEEACAYCHSDAANIDMRRNRVIKIAGEFRHMDEVVMPAYREEYGRNDIMEEGVSAGVEPNHKVHTEAGIGCMNCHLGVGHSGERFKQPEMETCFTCHDEVRATAKVPANEDCASCHVSQKGIQQGTYVKELPGDEWYMASLDCSDCHESAFVRPNTDKCVTCHEDASYGEMMSEIQASFNAKLPVAQKSRDDMMLNREHMSHGQLALANELIYIVRVIEKDGSAGVHNPEYFDTMFDKVAELEKAVAEYVEPVEAEEHHAPAMEAHGEEADAHAAPAEEAHGPVNSEELMANLDGIEVINLGEKYAPNGKKPAVKFEHKAHAEKLECTNCHSDPEGGVLKVEVPEEVKGTNNVFHKKLCITCHKEKKVKKSCNTCHKK